MVYARTLAPALLLAGLLPAQDAKVDFQKDVWPILEKTCVECHQGENDPHWNWKTKRALIVHSNRSGETLKKKTGATTMPRPPGSH